MRSAGEGYEVRFDTRAWHPARIVDGHLRLQELYAENGRYSPELELDVDGESDILLVGASPSPVPVALTQLSEAEYRTKLLAMGDRELKMTLYMLSFMAKEYAKTHGAHPPAVADMNAESAFGRFMARWEAPLPWPLNPFTGEDMHAGSKPGDFSYRTDGRGFELTALSSDGSVVNPGLHSNP